MLTRLWRAFDLEPQPEAVDSKRLLALCLEDPEQAKKLLKHEHRRVAEELEKTLEAYRQRMEDVSQKLRSTGTDRSTLEEEVVMLLREQREIERVVQRIALAEQETQQLLAEWQDWARHVQEGVSLDERSRLRLELLRSELTARDVQVRMPEVKVTSRMAPKADARRERVAPVPVRFAEWEMATLRQAQDLREDVLEDWEEVVGTVGLSRQEAKVALIELLGHLGELEPHEAAEAVRQLRRRVG